MSVSRSAVVVALALTLTLALAPAGCDRSSDRPRVELGAPCAACSMPIRDERFACVRGAAGAYRSYDAIECLTREGAAKPGEAIYLADYDTGLLHAADSIWVDRKSTRLNSSHLAVSRMPSSA